MIKLFKTEDFISTTNAVFGFLAIISIFNEQPRLSLIFILIAILADGLDGYIARKNGNKSKVGDFLEPMADMLSMGVAPLFLSYYIYQDFILKCLECQILITVLMLFFFVSIVIRLSSFYVIKNNEFFVGLPAPASGIVLTLLSYLFVDFYIFITVVFVLSLLMISNFHFKKPCLKINIIAAVLIFLVILLDHSFNDLFIWLLLTAFLAYSIFCPIYEKVKK